MGRDRDPFDRTIDALRHRLVQAGPLQGRALAINALAIELGVSQTPVREALARLAGEGLVVRTASGYAGRVYDATRLAQLYALSRDLLISSLTRRRVSLTLDEGAGAESAAELMARIAAGGGAVLAEAFVRAQCELAPFQAAELRVFGDPRGDLAMIVASLSTDPAGGAARGAVRVVRRHYDRRAARSREILTAALLREG